MRGLSSDYLRIMLGLSSDHARNVLLLAEANHGFLDQSLN